MSGPKEDLVWHMSCLGRKLISSAAVEYFWGYDQGLNLTFLSTSKVLPVRFFLLAKEGT